MEAPLDLFCTRASCDKLLASWLSLMFAALAYTLMQRLRAIALAGTELAQASTATIRVKLFKIGAVFLQAAGALSQTHAECCPGTLTNNGARRPSIQNSHRRLLLKQPCHCQHLTS